METLQGYSIPDVDRREVLRYLGYRGQTLTPELDARIDAVVGRAVEAARPRGVMRVFDVASFEQGEKPVVRLAGTALELPGHDIARHLAGAVAVGVLAVTIGMGFEQELRRLSLTNATDQAVFDSAGSALVERAADAAEAALMAEARGRGLYTGPRFSPGYGDLPLAVQPVLLEALSAQRLLGIALSSTLMMTPCKSVTAVVGFFGEPQPEYHTNCKGCLCFDFCSIRPTGRTCRD